jgi:hypothetical protein
MPSGRLLKQPFDRSDSITNGAESARKLFFWIFNLEVIPAPRAKDFRLISSVCPQFGLRVFRKVAIELLFLNQENQKIGSGRYKSNEGQRV